MELATLTGVPAALALTIPSIITLYVGVIWRDRKEKRD